MTLSNRRKFIHGLIGCSALAVGGCFTTHPEDFPDDPLPEIPRGLKTVHIWTDNPAGIDEDFVRLVAYPLNELNLLVPERAECIVIEGAARKPYPIRSVIRFDYPSRGITLFWYDGEAKPDIKADDLPECGVYLKGGKEGVFGPRHYCKKPQGDILEAFRDLVKKAKASPGRYVKP